MIDVVALSRKQKHHFVALSKHFNLIEVSDWQPSVLESLGNIDILITPSCDWYEAYACIQWARERSIPTLYLMDGIIEWRHQWENPNHATGGKVAFNQPLPVDKAACIGFHSARTLEGWGNIGKCEVVGLPRFDHYLTEPIVASPDVHPKRLLIMTANTPGFTDEQVKKVEHALQDLNTYLKGQSDWQPIWRIRKGLDQKLGLEDDFPQLRGQPLRDVLAQSHAVVTTPSTVLLESMLAGRPTALLDYTNSPPYAAAAWSITAKEHIEQTLADLLNPSPKRLVFQDEMLHLNLECYTPALPRIKKLIEVMVDEASRAKNENKSVVLSPSILPNGAPHYPADEFDFATLYDGHPVFSQKDTVDLQQQLTFAQQEIENLNWQLSRLKKRTLIATFMRKVFGK